MQRVMKAGGDDDDRNEDDKNSNILLLLDFAETWMIYEYLNLLINKFKTLWYLGSFIKFDLWGRK